MNYKDKRVVNFFSVIFIIALIATIIVLLIMKYDVEGEKDLPFKISKIIIASTAEGIQSEQPTAKWDLRIDENSDIYIYINKNENVQEEKAIKNISLENFQVFSNPQVGTPVPIRPSNVNGVLFKNSEEYEIKEKLEYTGNMESNIENLEIGNQGGIIYLRYCLKKLGNYVSDTDKEITHNGTLLKKININDEQTKYKISFDLILSIEKDKSYKANITLDLPAGDISETGSSYLEITDLNNVIFKRI